MLKKNVKLGIALVGMRHLNYKIYLKNNKIYPPTFKLNTYICTQNLIILPQFGIISSA